MSKYMNFGAPNHSDILMLIRQLRTNAKSFADGGADIADKLLYRLEGKLDRNEPENKHILDVLQNAADCFDTQPSNELLKQLLACKNTLLKRCIPNPASKN